VYDGLGRHVATRRIWDAGWGDGSGDLRTREFFHDGVRALAEVVQDPIREH